jgi:hypothetical protein
MIAGGARIITLDIETSPILAYNRAYYLANKEKMKAQARAYYAANREKVLAQERAKRKTNKAETADKKFRDKYGVSLAQVLAMFAAANGACECCGQALAKPASGASKRDVCHVDHCHTTGAVRGLLCGACNLALGLLKDKPEMAVAYLEKTR